MSDFSFAGLNWVDIAIVAIIVLSSVISLIRGFVREAISLATWIIAIVVAMKFSTPFSAYFESYIQTPSIRVATAFLILFLVLLLIGSLVNYLVSMLVNKTGLSGTDRVLGLIFGIARGVLFVGVLVMLAGMTAIPKEPWYQNSQIVPQFSGIADWLKGFVPEQMKKIKPVEPEISTGDQATENGNQSATEQPEQSGP